MDTITKRATICKDCPLYKRAIGGAICNGKLWLNPITNETSTLPLDGFLKGCGCVLKSKWASESNHCPLHKW